MLWYLTTFHLTPISHQSLKLAKSCHHSRFGDEKVLDIFLPLRYGESVVTAYLTGYVQWLSLVARPVVLQNRPAEELWLGTVSQPPPESWAWSQEQQYWSERTKARPK